MRWPSSMKEFHVALTIALGLAVICFGAAAVAGSLLH
jgi:hypothetical protein